MAAACDTEVTAKFHSDLRFVYISDVFLRPDIPCDLECTVNKTFREENLNSFPAKCRGVPYLNKVIGLIVTFLLTSVKAVQTVFERCRIITILSMGLTARGGCTDFLRIREWQW